VSATLEHAAMVIMHEERARQNKSVSCGAVIGGAFIVGPGAVRVIAECERSALLRKSQFPSLFFTSGTCRGFPPGRSPATTLPLVSSCTHTKQQRSNGRRSPTTFSYLPVILRTPQYAINGIASGNSSIAELGSPAYKNSSAVVYRRARRRHRGRKRFVCHAPVPTAHGSDTRRRRARLFLVVG